MNFYLWTKFFKMKKVSIIRLLVLISAVFFSLVITAQEEKPELTLSDIFKSPKFYPKMVYGLNSLNDGESYAVIKKDSLNVYSYETGEFIRTIVSGDQLIPAGDSLPLRLYGYILSEKEDKILIPTETESIYRHSTKANYYVYDIGSGSLQSLSENGKQRLADFSPDGSKVAFVRDNDIYIKHLDTGTETQITNDGEENQIINGTTDWVYEEEFGFTKGFFWSPDGEMIAYYRFDESKVMEYWMQFWGSLYPENYKYKYPKAGEDNSIVTIHVYHLGPGETINMDIGTETDQYIPRIKWSESQGLLAIQRMNRLQNHLEILFADASTGESKVIYSEDNKYYIDITDHWTFIPNSNEFLITSEIDGYNHIYLQDINGNTIKQLTSGNWDVTDLIGYDESRDLVYYVSAESSPLNRDIYAVSLKGKKKRISTREGTNKPQFSRSFDYYINTFSTANTPPVITINNRNGKEIRILEDNQKLVEIIQRYDFSQKEFFSFETSEGVKLNGWRILPFDFDDTRKYPVMMTVYGGPGSQTVLNSWGYRDAWYQYFAQNDVIVVSVDNRGTGARGEEFKKMTYLQLGKYETIDQIEAAKYLRTKNYVDTNHIGIFGWSYGGYMSTLCITKGADVFSTAIAVAPVTNWRYYDNIYTERYMRTPQENPDGYDNNSPIYHVDKMKGNYLLVHGTGDDNVHVQNSMDLITALVEADKQFDMILYPNKNHGIYGGNTTYHLYNKLTEFMLENLKD